MTTPAVIQCSSACTVQLELTMPPFTLTPDEAGQIGAAILLVWALGYGIRSVIRAIRIDGNHSGDSHD